MKKAAKLSESYFPKRPIHKEWVDLLKGFKKYLDRYRGDSDDVAYWYGERALSGFLASVPWAAWAEGWSLEEFTGLRKDRKKQDRNPGKGDLWIGIGEKEFTVEAKVAWSNGPILTTINDVRNKLKEAKRQLDALDTKYRVGFPAAVCYVVPSLASKTYGTPSHQDQFFSKVPKMLATSRRIVGAYRYENDKNEMPNDAGRLYPGLIVVTQFWSAW
jgi:hypothetical protein